MSVISVRCSLPNVRNERDDVLHRRAKLADVHVTTDPRIRILFASYIRYMALARAVSARRMPVILIFIVHVIAQG